MVPKEFVRLVLHHFHFIIKRLSRKGTFKAKLKLYIHPNKKAHGAHKAQNASRRTKAHASCSGLYLT